MNKKHFDFINYNKSNMSCREIARHINVNYQTVRYQCLKKGIVFSRYKNNGNIDYFKSIVDKKVAYLIGFLWADGYIVFSNSKPSGIGIEILLEDSVHIDNIFKKLFKKYKKYVRLRNKRTRKVITFIVNDTKLANLFIKKFEFDKKSIMFPNISKFIRKSLHSYFLRGYFDGDGYIDKYRISISSTFENDWSKFIDLCRRQSINIKKIRTYKHPIKPHSFSEIRMHKEDSKKFLKYIYNTYPSDKIGLLRKYTKYITYY